MRDRVRTRLTVNRYVLLAVVAWSILLVYFGVTDLDALRLSLVLTPAMAVLLSLAIWARHLTLTLFMVLALISHAVAPPFFFLKRQFYSYGGGFGAVKDFHFGVVEFLQIYLWVVVFLAATVLMTLGIGRQVPPALHVATTEGIDFAARVHPRNRRRAAWALAAFLLVFCIPLSLFMYANRIGITGVEPTVLPYRLTGILTYFRMFIVPVVIFVGYAVSSQGWPLAGIMLLYAFLGGVAGSSRYIVMMTAMPLALFALVRRRTGRVIAVMLATIVLFVVTTETRRYVYYGSYTYTELMRTTLGGVDFEDFGPFETIGGIANRLWGPQDVVLAYQYRTPNQPEAIRRYFAGEVVVEDMNWEFYGMILTGDSAYWGVGIGYIPWMILLADRSLAVLLVLALITALILSASEVVIAMYTRAPSPLVRSIAQPAAFFLVYTMYTSSLNWWTDAMLLSIAGLLLVRVVTQRRLAGRDAAVPAR